jgi:hypothetical protein
MRSYLLVFLASLSAGPSVRAQDREPQVPLQIALNVGTTQVSFKGNGTCIAVSGGSLYDVPAAQWSARQRTASGSVNLALWRLAKGGGDMFNLTLVVGPTMHQVSTVSVKGKGTVRGRGRVTFLKIGTGGTFTIDATADTGARISGTITCSAFTAPAEENG